MPRCIHARLAWALVGVLLITPGCATRHPPVRSIRPVQPPAETAPERRAEALDSQEVAIQLAAHRSEITVECAAPITVHAAAGGRTLSAGRWTFRPAQTEPARQRFHVLAKTYTPDKTQEAAAALSQWRSEGFSAELLTTGKRMQTRSGRIVDNTLEWLSLGQFATEAEAARLKAQLETRSQWSYIRAETIEPGRGAVAILDGAGRVLAQCMLPVEFDSAQPVTLDGASVGFWDEKHVSRSYGGILEIRIGPDGKAEVYERLPIEEYLAGVLPAEMPDSWPAEALKAQAVAARSEVLASLAGKHKLEGFDFCGTEHCRAYAGAGGRRPASDAAVQATAGMALTQGNRFVAAVFSSNCGGWTENNDNVWSGPADPALRGVPDMAPSMGASPANIESWLVRPPSAFCSLDERSFRWTRRFTVGELTALVNKQHDVGTVRAVEPGSRGVSGRLKTVRIVGSKKTVTVQKELAIRLAFGGLPSAMFTVQTEHGNNGPAAFVFRGGGRGHGVGLCQHGARGMALKGMDCLTILRHYFAGADVENLD